MSDQEQQFTRTAADLQDRPVLLFAEATIETAIQILERGDSDAVELTLSILKDYINAIQ
jgi:hypothetical protein